MVSFTTYFDNIKNIFNCWCCTAKSIQEQTSSHSEEEEMEIIFEIRSRAHLRTSDHKHPNYYTRQLTVD